MPVKVPGPADHPAELLKLAAEFHAWRAADSPRGVPDYASEAAQQKRGLPAFRQRLDALKVDGWGVHQKIDYLLLRSEMDALYFDLTIDRAFEDDPRAEGGEERRRIGMRLREREVAGQRPDRAHPDVGHVALESRERGKCPRDGRIALEIPVRRGRADAERPVRHTHRAQRSDRFDVDEVRPARHAHLHREQELGAAGVDGRIRPEALAQLHGLGDGGDAMDVEAPEDGQLPASSRERFAKNSSMRRSPFLRIAPDPSVATRPVIS